MYVSVCIVYAPSNLVYHVPTKIDNNYWRIICHLSIACVNILPNSNMLNFYCIGLKSTIASPLASQPCKYITCISFAQVPACNSCTASTAQHTGKSLQYVVLLVALQDLLHMLHLSFWDPHVLFWAVPLPSKEVLSMMWISLVM